MDISWRATAFTVRPSGDGAERVTRVLVAQYPNGTWGWEVALKGGLTHRGVEDDLARAKAAVERVLGARGAPAEAS